MKKSSGTMVAIMMVAILMGTFITAKSSTAEEKARDGRFILYDNGTVLDTKTNLMWAAKDNGEDIRWENAKIYCKNYRGGGYSDWRMPTQDEMAGLYDEGKSRPAPCDASFQIHVATKLIDITCIGYWALDRGWSEIGSFYFENGSRYVHPTSCVCSERTLPVRSGK